MYSMVVLVVDDEKKARNLLSTILREYCDDVSVVLEASNLMDGVREIKEHQPNVVFMDIEMPDYLGIEIFDFLVKQECVRSFKIDVFLEFINNS